MYAYVHTFCYEDVVDVTETKKYFNSAPNYIKNLNHQISFQTFLPSLHFARTVEQLSLGYYVKMSGQSLFDKAKYF